MDSDELPKPFGSSLDFEALLRNGSPQLSGGLGQDGRSIAGFEDLKGGMEGLVLQQEEPEPAPQPAPTNGDQAQPGLIPVPALLQAAAMLDPQYQLQVLQRVVEQQQQNGGAAALPGQPPPAAASWAPQPQALLPVSPAVLQMQQNLVGLLAPPGPGTTSMPPGQLPLPVGVPLPGFPGASMPVPQQQPGMLPATSAAAALAMAPGPFAAPTTVLPPPAYMVPLEAAGPAPCDSAAAASGKAAGTQGGSSSRRRAASRQRAQRAQHSDEDFEVDQDEQQLQEEEEHQPRRRGRKPKPAELLTEKQLRAREAQKRFRDRQRSRWREAEESLEAVSAELERERAQYEAAQLTNAVYEHMVEYKEQMLGALNSAHEFDPPPGIVIPPAMVEVMRREQLTKAYTPESIMRYAAAGYTEHMDDTGRVKQAPPFEAVAKDWGEIVDGLREVMSEARVEGTGSGLCVGGASYPTNGAMGANGFASAAAAAAPPVVLGPGQARESTPGELIELAAARSRATSEAAAAAAAASPAGTTAGAAGAAAGASGVEDVSMPQAAEGPAAGAAGAAQAADDVLSPRPSLDGDEARVRPAEHMLGRAAASKKLPWAVLDKGMEMRDGDDLYRFTGPQLRRIAKLLKRSGALCWQQAILFPDNAMKLLALRMDTCEVCQEEEALPRWRHVIRQLRLSPGQLEQLVALHSDFLSNVRHAMVDRNAALRRLRELRSVVLGTSQQGHVARSLVINECTGALINSVQVQNAAATSLTAGLFNLLDFPLQKVKLVVLSWPYYPQVHLLGSAAAMELGLDMSLYNAFNCLGGGDGQEDGQEEEEGGGQSDEESNALLEGLGGAGTAAAAAGGFGGGLAGGEFGAEGAGVGIPGPASMLSGDGLMGLAEGSSGAPAPTPMEAESYDALLANVKVEHY